MNSIILYIYGIVSNLIPESRGYGVKNAILRWAGAKIGENVRIYSSAKILGNGELVIGDDVHIGPMAFIYASAPAKVEIGSHVDIAPDVLIETGTHEIEPDGDHIGGKGKSLDVTIGPGSWLCARATILPGVTLPPKTIVAAGAVVTKSIDTPKSLLAGIPAAVKKDYSF